MNRTTISAFACFATVLAIIAGNVLAQDTAPDEAERREKLRKLGGVAAGIASEVADDAAKGGGAQFKGRVIILQEGIIEDVDVDVDANEYNAAGSAGLPN